MTKPRALIGLCVAGLAIAATLLTARPDRTNRPSWRLVEQRQLTLEVPIEGVVKARESYSFSPPPIPDLWNFKIAFLESEGKELVAGQPVIGFDTGELEQRLLDTQAERDTAEKTLEKRTQELDLERENERLALAEAEAQSRRARLKTDVPEELVARNELEQARLEAYLAEEEMRFRQERLERLQQRADVELTNLRQRFEQKRRRTAQLEANIEAMVLKAPQPGTLVYRSNWRNEKKKVGDNCWRNEVVAALPNLETLYGDSEAEEVYLPLLENQLPVRLRFDAIGDEAFDGTITSVSNGVRPRSWRSPERIVKLEVDLSPGHGARLRPGMRFEGTIKVPSSETMFTIPYEAVSQRNGEAFINRRRQGKAETVEVQLGRWQDGWVEVESGIQEGDRVLVSSSAPPP